MIEFIKQNWPYILSGICGLIVVASVVVKLTPNTKDDGIVAKIIKVLDYFSIVKTARDKKMISFAEDILNEKKEER